MATGPKAAIVTGAASGLGRAMALGLADNGIDVVAVDQNVSALAALATAMAGRRGSVLTHAADLTQAERVRGDRRRPRRSGLAASTSSSTMPASARRRCGLISEGIRFVSGRRRRSSGAASSP